MPINSLKEAATMVCVISEEGIDQVHRLRREFLSHLSRKSNFIQCLNDVTTRMYIYTVLNEKYSVPSLWRGRTSEELSDKIF